MRIVLNLGEAMHTSSPQLELEGLRLRNLVFLWIWNYLLQGKIAVFVSTSPSFNPPQLSAGLNSSLSFFLSQNMEGYWLLINLFDPITELLFLLLQIVFDFLPSIPIGVFFLSAILVLHPISNGLMLLILMISVADWRLAMDFKDFSFRISFSLLFSFSWGRWILLCFLQNGLFYFDELSSRLLSSQLGSSFSNSLHCPHLFSSIWISQNLSIGLYLSSPRELNLIGVNPSILQYLSKFSKKSLGSRLSYFPGLGEGKTDTLH